MKAEPRQCLIGHFTVTWGKFEHHDPRMVQEGAPSPAEVLVIGCDKDAVVLGGVFELVLVFDTS
jgi:hypothetical protein